MTIKVSNGSIKPIPNVVGSTEDQACQQLSDAGFDCVPEYVDAGADKVGEVTEQDPPADTPQEGGQVTIKIGGVKVPDFSAMTVDDAKAAAQNLDLAVEPADAEGDWKIDSQDVEAGEVVKSGDTVTVTAKDSVIP